MGIMGILFYALFLVFMSDMLSQVQFLLPKERKRRMQKGAEGSDYRYYQIIEKKVLYFRLNFSKQQIHN